MPEKKLPASRFAKVPKVTQAIELVYLPKRLAIFLSKEAQEGPGWSSTTPKPVIAFKTKSPRQASEIAVQYLMSLVQQGYQFPVAKRISQLTTVFRDQPVSEEDDEGEGTEIDPRTKLVRKLFLQAFRAAEQEKVESSEEEDFSESGSGFNLWGRSRSSGVWTVLRGVTPETQERWLSVFQKDADIRERFSHIMVSARKPHDKRSRFNILSEPPKNAVALGKVEVVEGAALSKAGVMGHEHLHRLVEANRQEQSLKSDLMHTFRVLSGLRSVLPTLQEAKGGPPYTVLDLVHAPPEERTKIIAWLDAQRGEKEKGETDRKTKIGELRALGPVTPKEAIQAFEDSGLPHAYVQVGPDWRTVVVIRKKGAKTVFADAHSMHSSGRDYPEISPKDFRRGLRFTADQS